MRSWAIFQKFEDTFMLRGLVNAEGKCYWVCLVRMKQRSSQPADHAWHPVLTISCGGSVSSHRAVVWQQLSLRCLTALEYCTLILKCGRTIIPRPDQNIQEIVVRGDYYSKNFGPPDHYFTGPKFSWQYARTYWHNCLALISSAIIRCTVKIVSALCSVQVACDFVSDQWEGRKVKSW